MYPHSHMWLCVLHVHRAVVSFFFCCYGRLRDLHSFPTRRSSDLDIFDRVRDAVDRTLGGGMADVNRSLGRLLKTVYRTGWRARDEATRQRLVAILDHVVGEVEALATAKSSPAA